MYGTRIKLPQYFVVRVNLIKRSKEIWHPRKKVAAVPKAGRRAVAAADLKAAEVRKVAARRRAALRRRSRLLTR
jgi:hypothetical protein